MAKTPRNAPCPCGSGKKYKKCHGGAPQDTPRLSASQGKPARVPPTSAEEARLRALAHFQLHQAREEQRRQMQGLGNPIIAIKHADHRLVAVGNRMHWSKTWKTFEDFLFDYIKNTMGPAWGTAELKKPANERHPLLNWYVRLCDFQRAHMTGPPGTVHRAQMSGAVKAYLHLAYDLYLIAHNAALQEELIRRLRDPTLFEGAVHEAHVVGMFTKAGFKIELEDESDNTRKHCEFVATHQGTGRVFAVEAKAFTTASGRSADLTRTPSVRTKLKDALGKTTPHERIVIIELARAETVEPGSEPTWLPDLNAEMMASEADIRIGRKPAPPAYVFVTNRSCIWADEGPAGIDFMAVYGFKIADFMPHAPVPLLDAVHARRRYAEIHELMKSFAECSHIPSSFDDRLPEETHLSVSNDERLRIGARYVVPDADGTEKEGVLVDAVVMEAWKAVAGQYRLDDGRTIMCRTPISDGEMAIYKASPSTFFGIIKRVPKGIQTPMDMFNFLHQEFSKMPAEKLQERMAAWPDPEARVGMSQADLADHYCERMATKMWLDAENEKKDKPAA